MKIGYVIFIFTNILLKDIYVNKREEKSNVLI